MSSTVRHRAGVLLFVQGRLAVIDRQRPGVGRYQVLPGGGVEPGETLPEAAVREVWEETGLRITVGVQPILSLTGPGWAQWIFRATTVGGVFGSGRGVEVSGGRPERGTYQPILVTHAQLAAMNLVPAQFAELVLRAWLTEDWWAQPIHLEDGLTGDLES